MDDNSGNRNPRNNRNEWCERNDRNNDNRNNDNNNIRYSDDNNNNNNNNNNINYNNNNNNYNNNNNNNRRNNNIYDYSSDNYENNNNNNNYNNNSDRINYDSSHSDEVFQHIRGDDRRLRKIKEEVKHKRSSINFQENYDNRHRDGRTERTDARTDARMERTDARSESFSIVDLQPAIIAELSVQPSGDQYERGDKHEKSGLVLDDIGCGREREGRERELREREGRGDRGEAQGGERDGDREGVSRIKRQDTDTSKKDGDNSSDIRDLVRQSESGVAGNPGPVRGSLVR